MVIATHWPGSEVACADWASIATASGDGLSAPLSLGAMASLQPARAARGCSRQFQLVRVWRPVEHAETLGDEHQLA